MTEQFNYWEAELGDIKTAGADDKVRVKFHTSCSDTKWLNLEPDEFEAVEELLVHLYAKRLYREELAARTVKTQCWHVSTKKGQVYGVTATNATEAKQFVEARLADEGQDDSPYNAIFVAMWEAPFGTVLHY
jgi:hypothetical protein